MVAPSPKNQATQVRHLPKGGREICRILLIVGILHLLAAAGLILWFTGRQQTQNSSTQGRQALVSEMGLE